MVTAANTFAANTYLMGSEDPNSSVVNTMTNCEERPQGPFAAAVRAPNERE